MDFLALRNLTIIDDALDNIEKTQGHRPVLEDLTLDDPATYELLSRGDTLGVFQLDGGPMRSLLRLLRPERFEDISAVLALYRPGPMGADSHTNYALRKNGVQEITPLHPDLAEALEPILGETYGLIVYQEQVMAIAQQLAGYTLAQADLLRRAMGKKKKEELDIQFEAFSKGMTDNGYSANAVKTLWDILVPFSDYAFNKAHSAAYGVISYWTGYLKAHYPAEYMAALLTSVSDDKDKSAIYLAECRRMKIDVLPPDVNESEATFAAIDGSIRFGMGAIRNVGVSVVEHIKAARESKGAFTDFHDFVSKVPVQALNRRTVDSLIKAGAFDQLGNTRRSLAEIHETVVDQAVRQKKAEEHGDVGFDFDALLATDDTTQSPKIINLPEWSKRELLSLEREMLGLYVSDHPLAGLELGLAEHAEMTVAQLLDSDLDDGSVVSVAGLVTSANHRVARNSGNPYAQVAIEDFSGEIQVMFLGRSYSDHQALLQPDTILGLRGRVQRRDDQITLHAQQATALDLQPQSQRRWEGPFVLSVPEYYATAEVLTQLDAALNAHPGDTEVRLRLISQQAARVFSLPRPVEVTANLIAEVKGILGRDCLMPARATRSAPTPDQAGVGASEQALNQSSKRAQSSSA